MQETPNAKLKYIPLSEAGKILNTSRDYVNVLVRRGKLHAIKFGRNWVTTFEWLSAYQKSVGRIQSPVSEAVLLAEEEKAEFKELKIKLSEGFKTRREKNLAFENLISASEIKLEPRSLKNEERANILESVNERMKLNDAQDFEKAARKFGILKTLKNQSLLKIAAVSFAVVTLIASWGLFEVRLSEISKSDFRGIMKYQAAILSDVLNDFPNDVPDFYQWISKTASKTISDSLAFLKSKSQSELTVGELLQGESKIIKPQEALTRVDTFDEALALDAPTMAPGMISETPTSPVSEIEEGAFTLIENRLSVVETDLKDQTDLINSELSLQKKTILGVIETMFGLAKLVPSYPISTIVVQGQPATLTTYSVAPQIQTGFDRLSATSLTLASDATINGHLTVKSGGTFNTLSVSGDTGLTGNATIGGTLTVTGDATLGNLTLTGTISASNSQFNLRSASTTNLTVSGDAWINQLAVTGTATTTFNNPVTSFSGDFTIAGDSANDVLLNPYGGNVGIGTTSPNNLLTIAGATTPALGFTT